MGTRERAAALGSGVTVASGGLTVWLVRTTVGQWPGLGPVPLDGAVGFLSTAVAAGVATWLTVVVAAATLPLLGPQGRVPTEGAAHQPARGEAPSVTAGAAGRVTAALLAAAALGAGPTAAHAGAAPTDGTQVVAHLSSGVDGASSDGASRPSAPPGSPALPDGTTVPVPGWTPTADAPGRARTAQATATSASLVTTGGAGAADGSSDEADHVVVHRGDSLWSIAARHLGEQATDADVADAWPRWYAANRELIGEDPDLLLPGQVLVVPTGADR